MTNYFSKITVAEHARVIRTDILHEIIEKSHPTHSHVQFQKEQLERDMGIQLKQLDRDRYKHLQIPIRGYWLGIFGQIWRPNTLGDVLVAAMGALGELDPILIEDVASMKKSKRRYVARDPVSIYPSRPDLAAHAREFKPGWYVDTNQSFPGTASFLVDIFGFAKLQNRSDWYFGFLS